MANFSQQIHPGKLTCPLKWDDFNRKYIFQPLIFRGHVSFPGSTFLYTLYQVFWWTKSFHDNFMGILYYQRNTFFCTFFVLPKKTSLSWSFFQNDFHTKLPNRADFHGPVSTIQGDFKGLMMSRWEGWWRDRHAFSTTHFERSLSYPPKNLGCIWWWTWDFSMRLLGMFCL